MGNFEWDLNVAQLKDVEFILTAEGWNKFQISLCVFFCMDKLFLNFVQCVCLFATGLYLHCTADGSCEIIQYIRTDLPDYTVS